uniref:FMRFamide-like peptide n=1 Tax=Periplaneta americana TaxID=6978 RepID=Q69GG1_PERAM|nr:FMRFamide-like peptide precursor [Periplaneta americana]
MGVGIIIAMHALFFFMYHIASSDVLDGTNTIDNVAALDISEDEDDCEPESSITSLPLKRAEEQNQPPPVRRRCSNRNFVRLGRGHDFDQDDVNSSGEKDESLVRIGRGGRSNDNFIRFGRGGKNDNFIRFGRGGKQDNFIRFGRDRSDNFIRFGRGKTDNFIRFGRGRSDNFIRFGRGKSDNFIRFGRARPDNFIRFGRGKQDFIRFGRGNSNFVRFGRDDSSNVETFDTEEEATTDSTLRVGRGGKSGSNFIRFGRARPSSNFIRLGRRDEEVTQREERGRPSNNFVRFGRQTEDDDKFVRLSRSGNSNELRRGKLTDRNFIRLGRSGPSYDEKEQENEDGNSVRLGRSENPSNSRNFIRLGKRALDQNLLVDEHLMRFGRDVEQIENTPVASSGEPSRSDTDNKTKENYQQSRSKRSISFSEEDSSEDSSDYPVMIPNSAYDDVKIPSPSVEDSQIPFRYYSPLSSGIPNYILGPELSVLPPLSNESKRGRGDGHNRNYIRLG